MYVKRSDEGSGKDANHLGWHPLLASEAAERVWRTILTIAEAVGRARSNDRRADTGAPPTEDVGLSSGAAGQALFYAYLAEARVDANDAETHGATAMSCVDRAIDALADVAMGPGLYSGFTGVGWVVDHLTDRLFETDAEGGSGPEIDEALARRLSQGAWARHYDLISGLVGFGVYALEALPRSGARRCLELIVQQLEDLAEDRHPGLTWFTAPELLPPTQVKGHPKGYYNLGVAHGVPGVVAVLARIYASGVATQRLRPLLDQAISWLLAQESETGSSSRFPTWVGEDIGPRPSRLAWCYGDAGVAAALLLAARCVGRDDWEGEAIRVARRAAQVRFKESGVVDAGLCHGTAGLGHIFNRLYQATGDDSLARAARAWFEQTWELERPGEGVGGFFHWGQDGRGELGWRPETGFLVGASGIGLALLAAVSNLEPKWDRVLLTSIPPRLDHTCGS